jgi:hypothetical protein
VTTETDVIITEADDQLKEALLKQLKLAKEKDALAKGKAALKKDSDALIEEKDVQLAAFRKETDALAMEKDALAKQLAAVISTCDAPTDRSVEIPAAVAYPPSQAAAAGAQMRRHTHATRP